MLIGGYKKQKVSSHISVISDHMTYNIKFRDYLQKSEKVIIFFTSNNFLMISKYTIFRYLKDLRKCFR